MIGANILLVTLIILILISIIFLIFASVRFFKEEEYAGSVLCVALIVGVTGFSLGWILIGFGI